jgi:hypothetical protein
MSHRYSKHIKAMSDTDVRVLLDQLAKQRHRDQPMLQAAGKRRLQQKERVLSTEELVMSSIHMLSATRACTTDVMRIRDCVITVQINTEFSIVI